MFKYIYMTYTANCYYCCIYIDSVKHIYRGLPYYHSFFGADKTWIEPNRITDRIRDQITDQSTDRITARKIKMFENKNQIVQCSAAMDEGKREVHIIS